MHAGREAQSLAIHRRIAGVLAERPREVIDKARSNLESWLKIHHGSALETVYREWRGLLDTLTPDEISALIVAEGETATRLRQSSPFAGVLSPAEIWSIKRSHAAA